MNPSKRPAIFRGGYEALLLLHLIVSLYFCLFVCLQSAAKALVCEAPLPCPLVEKSSKDSRQCTSPLTCPNSAVQKFSTTGKIITLVQPRYSFDVIDHTIAASIMSPSTATFVMFS